MPTGRPLTQAQSQTIIAMAVDADHSTVTQHLASRAPLVDREQQKKQPALLERWEAWAHATFNKLERDDASKDGLGYQNRVQGTTAAAIATDKIQLLKGQPTAILGHADEHRRDVGELLDRLIKVRQRLARKNVTPAIPEETG